jgi:NAD(P)-dependent dehydrogenase (short-subunit alcohol dehydrogenase family)
MANISMANSGARAGKPLAGGVALVTGSSRGIGRAIAQRLAQLGAAVSLCGRNEESLMRTAEAVRALGVRVHAQTADVTRAGKLPRWSRPRRKRWGPLRLW